MEMQGSEAHTGPSTLAQTMHVVNGLAVTEEQRPWHADRLVTSGLHTVPLLAIMPAGSTTLHWLSFIPVFSPLLLFQGSRRINAVWFL